MHHRASSSDQGGGDGGGRKGFNEGGRGGGGDSKGGGLTAGGGGTGGARCDGDVSTLTIAAGAAAASSARVGRSEGGGEGDRICSGVGRSCTAGGPLAASGRATPSELAERRSHTPPVKTTAARHSATILGNDAQQPPALDCRASSACPPSSCSPLAIASCCNSSLSRVSLLVFRLAAAFDSFFFGRLEPAERSEQ